ncbi:MAG: hypothetical protein AAF672_01590 [Pseudomonadota bacterium]
MRVASWPGKGDAHNPFLNIFLGGLEQAGCFVDSVEGIADLERAVQARPDIVMIHWAERVFAESLTRWQALGKMRQMLRTLARRSDSTRVVWLVHNLAPHDARRFQRLVWPHYVTALSKRVDGFMTLAPGTLGPVARALPHLAGKPSIALWHPAYPDAALDQATRHAARADLGIGEGDTLLGYCGQIRPYKGVSELLAQFIKTQDPSLKLLVAGRPQENRPGAAAFLTDLRAKAASDPRITLRLGDLSADAFRTAQGVCDRIVAPFRHYLHSGSLVHALSAKRPVLTPRTPFAESYREQLGASWISLYEGDLKPEYLLEHRVPETDIDLSPLANTAVGTQARAFFEQLR